jgi:hypothetical protein
MWAELLEGANTELPEAKDESITMPTFKHVPRTIIYPVTSRPLPKVVADNPHVLAFFDGGAAGKIGTGGFVVFGHEEHCLVAKASYYGELWNTNNRAELHALVQLMEWLEHN